MADIVAIKEEADLWALLASAAASTDGLPSADDLRITGWNPRLLYFPTESVGHSISPSLARAVAGFHNNLSRSFSYAIYGRDDARRLHLDDREALDIRILVFEGSNGLQVMEGALDRLTHAILTKMSGRQMSLLVVLYLLLNFGETTMRDWLHEEYAAKVHQIDEDGALKLSAEETRRMEIMASVLNQKPNLKPLASIAADGRIPLLRGTLGYENSKILDVPITRDEAATIVAKERDRGTAKRLDGRYEVVEIDTENDEGFMGTLRDEKTMQEIRVSMNFGELPEQDRRALFDALEGKSSVIAAINAWMIGEKISYASIVRADPITK